jgi:hypothetical protein
MADGAPFTEPETVVDFAVGGAVITTGVADVGVGSDADVEVEAGGLGVVYARTYEISKYALSYFGLPGPTTLSLYCCTCGSMLVMNSEMKMQETHTKSSRP